MGQSKTKLNLIICGIDNAGKTTIVNQLKPEHQRTENLSATVGYNVDTFSNDKVKFTAFDMGGSKKFRTLWECYYANVHGVVFVIDSSDALRMCVVRDEIQQMLEHADLKYSQVPFLFFANKMDVQNAKSPAELTQILELDELMGDRPFNIFASDALKGVGLTAGMDWLQKVMLRQHTTTKAK